MLDDATYVKMQTMTGPSARFFPRELRAAKARNQQRLRDAITIGRNMVYVRDVRGGPVEARDQALGIMAGWLRDMDEELCGRGGTDGGIHIFDLDWKRPGYPMLKCEGYGVLMTSGAVEKLATTFAALAMAGPPAAA